MHKVKVIIIGSGFGGLCVGIKLKLAGINDFLILEKADDLGGTWRDNTYPGAECDIPSTLYSYSFEHNDTWQSKWSDQKQIHYYQRNTAEKHEIISHIKYRQRVSSLTFNDESKRWLVVTSNGEQFDAQHVVCAVGQLHYPSTPKFDGVERFYGTQFNAAKWDHSVDLSSKSVAVIGNAASAVQFIPEVAKTAKNITIFQRSPNWILPKIDRRHSKFEQRLSVKFPFITKMYRWWLWAIGEYGMFPAIKGNRFNQWLIKKMCLNNLNKHISSSELKAKLVPDYPIGAKRVLFSDLYYPALARDNVHLISSGVSSFSEHGVIDGDNKLTEAEVVIYGTGFKTNPFLSGIDVSGKDGRSLKETWKEGAHAFLGVSVNGYPNLHLLYGPNTNLGHTSIIIMLEAQSDYTLSLIQHTDEAKLQSCEVNLDAETHYNRELQLRLTKLAFSKIENSWYKDGNKITNNWAGGSKEYVNRLKKQSLSAYDFY